MANWMLHSGNNIHLMYNINFNPRLPKVIWITIKIHAYGTPNRKLSSSEHCSGEMEEMINWGLAENTDYSRGHRLLQQQGRGNELNLILLCDRRGHGTMPWAIGVSSSLSEDIKYHQHKRQKQTAQMMKWSGSPTDHRHVILSPHSSTGGCALVTTQNRSDTPKSRCVCCLPRPRPSSRACCKLGYSIAGTQGKVGTRPTPTVSLSSSKFHLRKNITGNK